MATYKKIQKYVKDSYGFQPKSCWIAHVKEVCNIPVKISHNRHNSNKRQVSCPESKQAAIKDTFRYFGML